MPDAWVMLFISVSQAWLIAGTLTARGICYIHCLLWLFGVVIGMSL